MQLQRQASQAPAARRRDGSLPVPRSRARTQAVSAAAPSVQLEDKFLASNMPQLYQSEPASPSLQGMRSACMNLLPTLRMPTTRNEEYRFTDISPLLRANLVPAGAASLTAEDVSKLVPQESATSYVTVVNGVVHAELSNLSGLPAGSYVGGASGAPAEVLAKLGTQAATRGGPFSVLNGAAARDVLVVALPATATVESPIYVLHVSTSGAEGTTAANAPRLLLHAGQGASCSLVEEWVSGAQQPAASSSGQAPPYFSCAVGELFLERDAAVSHAYVVREAEGAVHFNATLVQQEEASSYKLTEARLGGALTRHDVNVSQAGARTSTTMRHFLLAGPEQLHDLHTKLGLDHPEGEADQLHKCIVTSPSGRGVFDGNVRVGRLAQRTDAGQLSRNLLLAPRATVNVKPNLQIIADDVKCTHGCAVSNLSEEELFYFRARGISAMAARQSLVASFGAEVTQGIKLGAVQARIQADMRSTLEGVDYSVLA